MHAGDGRDEWGVQAGVEKVESISMLHRPCDVMTFEWHHVPTYYVEELNQS